jgi:hypothetical protein
MPYPIEKYENRAKQIFFDLTDTFSKAKEAWRIGNVFDTLTDYLVRYPDAEKNPGTVAGIALKLWRDPDVARSMCWYDDYGWWGIAGAKAFDDKYARIFGSTREDFKKIATGCWDIMHAGKPDKAYKYKGGPNVWTNRENGAQTDYFTSPDTWAKPRFEGGVWQYDMWKGARPDGTECTPNGISDPNEVLLGPFQLTVMNGLYLVLALRLRQRGSGAIEAIKSEIGFLKNWFLEPTKQEDKLLWLVSPDSGHVLVRERVATYAESNKSCKPVQGYKPDGAWCGDQGLILGGLLDYHAIEPSGPVHQLALDIVDGVLEHMVSEDNVVQPHSEKFDDHGDPGDYSCGSGVFWRYLLRGFGEDATLRDRVLNRVKLNPKENPIFKSAEDACTQRIPDDDKLFAQFNVLATLTAAIEIFKRAAA